MEKEDGRKLSPEAQHERRKQAVRMSEKGIAMTEIARTLSMSVVTICHACQAFRAGGWDALKPKQRGRAEGAQRHLSDEQESHIKKMISDKRPDQYKLEFALWTRGAVKLLIEQEYQLVMPIRTVGEYLKRWGFTPQRPIVRAYEQNPVAVAAWLDETYPKIVEKAKAENAEIHWGDETAVVNTDVRGRGFAPKGKTPLRFANCRREKLSMISTVTNQGQTRWMIIDDTFNADRLIDFLKALIQDSNKKVFLILDNLRVHHSKLVKAWVLENKEKIELFYLPSYSPELNPDERLNADLKYAIGSKVAVRTKSKLKLATEQHMQMLEQNPERVLSYFGDEKIRYAA